jgi:uncharacterized protein (TIGR02996 family)
MTPDAFKHTIREHPQDDGPRLIFADWLEEHGDCDYAEFIRVQCELEQTLDDDRWAALSRREAELLEKHRTRWQGPWELSRHVRMRRGFLEAQIDAHDAQQLPEEFLQAEALLELVTVGLFSTPGDIGTFVAWRGRELITGIEPEFLLSGTEWSYFRRALELNWPRLAAVTLPAIEFTAADVASLAAMPQLRRLKLRNCRVPPSSGNWHLIMLSPIVERLMAIELESTPLAIDEIRELARFCNRATNLTQLTLNKCRLGANEFKEFIQSADLRRLTHLDLTGNPLRDSGVRWLAEYPNFDSLAELNLNGCECGKPGIQALMKSGLIRRLTALHLNNNFLGDAAVRALLNSGEMGSIRRFSLGSDLTDNGLGFIANSPAASLWRELTVQGSSFTAGGFLALVRSTGLSNLSRLTLFGLSLNLGHLPNLNRKPFLNRLRELTIARQGLTVGQDILSRDSVVNLLSSPSLPRLQMLRVPAVQPVESVSELRQRFGPRFDCDLVP